MVEGKELPYCEVCKERHKNRKNKKEIDYLKDMSDIGALVRYPAGV